MNEDLTMFRWESENRLWDKIHGVLDEKIRNVTNYATMRDIPDSESECTLRGAQWRSEHKCQLMELYT